MAWKTKPPYNIPVNPAHPLASDLQGCWLFNEGEGLVANDLSGNGNTGAFIGAPAWTTGNGGGNAILLNGTSDYIRKTGFVPDMAATTPISLEILAYLSSGGATQQHLLELTNIQFYRTGTTLSYKETATFNVTNSLTQDAWNHIAVTRSASGAINMYVDGVSVKTGTEATPLNPGTTMVIGELYTQSGNYYLNGKVSIARIWNRALTAAEVLSLYNTPYDMFLDPQVNFLRGTATVTQGNTTATVTHGLGFVPSLVWLQPLSDSGKKWFVTNRTATTFQINLPAAAQADVSFNYGVA